MTGTIEETQTLALIPDRVGYISTTLSYSVPRGVSKLQVSVPSPVDVERSRGFRHTGSRQMVWNGGGRQPTLDTAVYTTQVDQANRGAQLADQGSWAIAEAPYFDVRWWSTGGDYSYERDVKIDGQGVSSSDGYVAYLGPYREHTARVGPTTLRLVVPRAASLAHEPATILDALSSAVRSLDLGRSPSSVMGVAAPARPVNWASDGLQRGRDGFWVRDQSSLRTANPTWIHEYVHTVQDFEVTANTTWLVEGTASYFATRAAFEQGLIDERTFTTAVNTTRSEEAVLSNPALWPTANAPYNKGLRVAAWLDAELTAETDGEGDLQTVFRALNDHEGQLTHGDLKRYVRAAGGDADLVNSVDRFVTATDAPPKVWPVGVAPETDTTPDDSAVAPDSTQTSGTQRISISIDGRIDEHVELSGDDEGVYDETDLFEDVDDCDVDIDVEMTGGTQDVSVSLGGVDDASRETSDAVESCPDCGLVVPSPSTRNCPWCGSPIS